CGLLLLHSSKCRFEKGRSFFGNARLFRLVFPCGRHFRAQSLGLTNSSLEISPGFVKPLAVEAKLFRLLASLFLLAVKPSPGEGEHGLLSFQLTGPCSQSVALLLKIRA